MKIGENFNKLPEKQKVVEKMTQKVDETEFADLRVIHDVLTKPKKNMALNFLSELTSDVLKYFGDFLIVLFLSSCAGFVAIIIHNAITSTHGFPATLFFSIFLGVPFVLFSIPVICDVFYERKIFNQNNSVANNYLQSSRKLSKIYDTYASLMKADEPNKIALQKVQKEWDAVVAEEKNRKRAEQSKQAKETRKREELEAEKVVAQLQAELQYEENPGLLVASQNAADVQDKVRVR